jgi:hypothetical protein
MSDVSHYQLDGSSRLSTLGVAHLALLGTDNRTSALSQKLEKWNLASAIQEKGVGIENIDCQEAIIEVLRESYILIFDPRDRGVHIEGNRKQVRIMHRII